MPNLPDPVLQGNSNSHPSADGPNSNNPGQTIQVTPVTNLAPVPAQPAIPVTVSTTSAGNVHKEVDPFPIVEPILEEIKSDVDLTPQLEKIGVEKRSETIELPPDMKKMGVQAVGPTQPVTYTGAVKLPLADDQIVTGLHAQIMSSIRWLAEWCVRKLKMAHIKLKTSGNTIVREPV